ncbi:recombinase zinc beta ribbon domain-containing protein [Pelagicoccus sp. NFK12]|uniref:Recombinase zinc beta ribbon domain-containing protein n=2 Tax=Pelagicoccus enzymogenes TaxID=2773457 RepID=A0A927IIR8_9BACT|nr:recombinase zinc beta ribbon domain-containing protein [Pelagicoccus enzymogenes]
MVCTTCGRDFTPKASGNTLKNGTPHLYYDCASKIRKEKNSCGCSLPARKVETLIIDTISAIGRDKKVIESCVENLSEMKRVSTTPIREEIKTLQSELRQKLGELEKWKKKVFSVEGALAKELQSEAEAVAQRKQELEVQLAKRTLDIRAHEQELASSKDIAAALTNFSAIFEELEYPEQKELLGLLIQQIRIQKIDSANARPNKCIIGHRKSFYEMELRFTADAEQIAPLKNALPKFVELKSLASRKGFEPLSLG